MQPLTLTEIDAELADRQTELDVIAATLLELDEHPGHTLLQRYSPTGRTEQRWRPVRAALALMWEDFGRLRSILDSARRARGSRTRLDVGERTELTRLLRERPYEVSRTPIPMAQRSLTGPKDQVLFVGLADTVDRMRSTFPEIAEFFDEVDAVNTRVLSVLAPLQAQVDRAGALTPELRAIGDGIADLLARSAEDPLALTVFDIDSRVTELTEQLRREARLIAELAAMARDWQGVVADTRQRWGELRDTRDRAARARAHVERSVLSGPLPGHADDTAAMAAELDTVAADAGATAALLDLRRRIADATVGAAAAEQLAQGLLDRKVELRGRLAAYLAKASRLGISEDRDVLASHRIAAGLLARRPCDLAAVTRAVADYQQIIGEKSGRRG